MTEGKRDLVLVTGGTGFVAAWILVTLLQRGYRVRTTVRTLRRADEVKAALKEGGCTEEQVKSVEFFEADLAKNAGWFAACEGCVYVHHVASPTPATPPRRDKELTRFVRDGTLSILNAAQRAGVKRIVMTGSAVAVTEGHSMAKKKEFTEEDWACIDDPNEPVGMYTKIKVIAEKTAWNWAKSRGSDIELVSVLPASINGPLLSKQTARPVSIIGLERLLNGWMPGTPNMWSGIVDVRDLADLHLRCMLEHQAAGQRYVAVSDDGYVPALTQVKLIKDSGGRITERVPVRTIPQMVMNIMVRWDPLLRQIQTVIGKQIIITNKKAKTELGWQPRSAAESWSAATQSLDKLGLLRRRGSHIKPVVERVPLLRRASQGLGRRSTISPAAILPGELVSLARRASQRLHRRSTTIPIAGVQP